MTTQSRKILFTSLISILLAILLYLLSYTPAGKFTLTLTTFSSTAVLLLILGALSFFWIFVYYSMDVKKKEPVKALVQTFFVSVAIHFLLLKVIDVPLKEILLPVLSIYIIFDLFIFNLPCFDETVDSLIYGGVAGIGLGVAASLNEFLVGDSLSFAYLIQLLSVRILLYSSVCALSGLLLNKMKNTDRLLFLILDIVILFVIFGANALLENLYQKNLKLSQYEILGLLFPLALSLFVFGITVCVVAFTIVKEYQKKTDSIQFRIFGILIVVLIFINGLFIKTEDKKSKSFVNQETTLIFKQPVEKAE